MATLKRARRTTAHSTYSTATSEATCPAFTVHCLAWAYSKNPGATPKLMASHRLSSWQPNSLPPFTSRAAKPSSRSNTMEANRHQPA